MLDEHTGDRICNKAHCICKIHNESCLAFGNLISGIQGNTYILQHPILPRAK